jgi:hypothetical protein
LKEIESGATVIVAGDGEVGCVAALGELAAPVQPEMETIAEMRMSMVASAKADLPVERSEEACFAALQNPSFMFSFLITQRFWITTRNGATVPMDISSTGKGTCT